MDNSLLKHYDQLYLESIKKFKTDKYETDRFIDSNSDNRFGITLLFRPDNEVRTNIQIFIDKLKSVEADQYYYPISDIHITVMSIIACYSGFKISQINIEEYVRLIGKSVAGLKSFNIEFKGLTASSSCIMVRGFPENDTLNQIRNNLRIHFKESNLEHSIDKRYYIKSTHCTIVRIRKKLFNKTEFIKHIEGYKDFYFGSSKISNLEFVFNDWYQRDEKVKKLYEFQL